MITIHYFTGSGHSLTVAKALAELLNCETNPMDARGGAVSRETAVAVFPVYCQNIPKPVKTFLKTLQAKHVVLIATYGKISWGNVLYEARKLVSGQVIAGACIPIGHTFLDGDHEFDRQVLLPIVQRIHSPKEARIPRTRKNPLANLFPALRSRMGVKLTKGEGCDGCGLCEKNCPMGAIRKGRIHAACIRCMRCVTNCPNRALQYKNSPILDWYLKRYCREAYALYL